MNCNVEKNNEIIVNIINRWQWLDLAGIPESDNLSLSVYQNSKEIVSCIFEDFAEWLIYKKNFMISSETGTKIFLLDTILKYLCFENPLKKIYEGHSDKIVNIIKLNSGNILSNSNDGSIILWNLKENKNELIFKIDNGDGISSMIYYGYREEKDCDYILASCENTRIYMIQIDEKNKVYKSKVIDQFLETAWETIKLNNLCICSLGDCHIHFLNLRSNRRSVIRIGNDNDPERAAPNSIKKFSETKFMCKGSDDSVHIWDITVPSHYSIPGNPDPNYCCEDVEGLLIKFNDHIIIYTIDDINILIYNMNNNISQKLEISNVLITSIIKLNDRSIVIGDLNGKIYLVDISDGVVIISLPKLHNIYISNILRINDDVFVSGSSGCSEHSGEHLILWDMKKQKFTLLTCVTNHCFYDCVCSQSKYSKHRTNSTLFKYDDFTFFSGSWDSTITMWNIEQLIK